MEGISRNVKGRDKGTSHRATFRTQNVHLYSSTKERTTFKVIINYMDPFDSITTIPSSNSLQVLQDEDTVDVQDEGAEGLQEEHMKGVQNELIKDVRDEYRSESLYNSVG